MGNPSMRWNLVPSQALPAKEGLHCHGRASQLPGGGSNSKPCKKETERCPPT
ncbi:hypothetical protein FPOAC1_010728 [Fusarium poae]|uniref:hypothetical protein n=1 Tax=Fusarium poae TaxID=36050 RepID=UPI001CE980A4|nr:hypothetical protein FPOAC1_010728 [Fusarium poae]KAG8665927.1 hypothetical protein FPOAC1_010728 [Fusarium poae]